MMNSRANIVQFICTIIILPPLVVYGFSTTTSLLQRIPSSPINNIHQPSPNYQNNNNNILLLHQSKIIDVEVIPNEEPDSSSSSSTTTNPSTSQEEEDELNLIQYSQNQDPEWKDMPISYCDSVSNTYIDCNLVFYVKDPSFKDSSSGKGRAREAGASEYEGAEYALGVPTEIPIVVALELDDNENDGKSSNKGGTNTVNLNKVLPINPDFEEEVEGSMTEEEKEEIFQLAARALQTEYGKSIRMKKTPRVLTLEGDLDDIIGNWKDVLLGNNNNNKKKEEISIDDALNVLDEDDVEEEDYFDKIMRRDLGDDYMSLLDDDDDDEELDAKLLKLFDNSAISDEEESLDTLLNEIKTQESQYKETTYNDIIQQLQPSAALKLLNFIGPGDKEYTILKPLRPILLVGKEDPSDYTRRILLTEEERRVILPRLEKSCRDGLEEAGYFLDGGSGGSKLGV